MRKSGATFLSFMILFVLWELVGRFFDLLFLPPFSEIIMADIDLIRNGTFLQNLLPSLASLGVGLLVSLAPGVILGVLMGYFDWLEEMLRFYIDLGMSAPTVALVPIFIALFGVGNATIIGVIFVFTFFVVVVNASTGVKEAKNSNLAAMAQSFGASPWRIFYRVILPGALPLILTGIRLGVGRSIKGLITGEMLVVITGLGGVVMQLGGSFSTERLWAMIINISIISLIGIGIVRLITDRMAAWQDR